MLAWSEGAENVGYGDGGGIVPNFFLMTLRIFFWSNFLGRPWTVVKVLRPLRSVGGSASQHAAYLNHAFASDAGLVRNRKRSKGKLTLNTDVYVILRLLRLTSIFVGFGEGVCIARMLAGSLAIRFGGQ